MTASVTVIGGGLAGCEAAWQLAQRGVSVRLVEMKPRQRTPAQTTDHLAELVCSNSLRSANVVNPVGLIKEEMRRLDSVIVQAATDAQVPAGDALAVDRERFAAAVSQRIDHHPCITRVTEVITALPTSTSTVVATGPLTAPDLATDIQQVTGQDRLYFYDAIAPIIAGASVDRSIAFAASRYGKGTGDDYLNCPLDEAAYEAFVTALLEAPTVPLHSFEEPKYFQGCLPIEVVAQGGRESLRFGCMKPVGLADPRTGARPYAVVQLRQEDVAGQAFNLVGFQTKLKHPEQKRIFRMIPGLENVEFLRLGGIHRNTYLDSPTLLDERMRLRVRPNIRFAGQITGVEGYVESSAHGLVTGRLLAADMLGQSLTPPPQATALGALWEHVQGLHRLPGRPYEPQNINGAMFPPPETGVPKVARKHRRVEKAVHALEQWADVAGIALAPRSTATQALLDAPLPARLPRRRRRVRSVARSTSETH